MGQRVPVSCPNWDVFVPAETRKVNGTNRQREGANVYTSYKDTHFCGGIVAPPAPFRNITCENLPRRCGAAPLRKCCIDGFVVSASRQCRCSTSVAVPRRPRIRTYV